MSIFAGWLTLVCPFGRVHSRTSLISWFLLPQECPACIHSISYIQIKFKNWSFDEQKAQSYKNKSSSNDRTRNKLLNRGLTHLFRCGKRPYEWGPLWDLNSFVKVCSSSLLTITRSKVIRLSQFFILLQGSICLLLFINHTLQKLTIPV